MKLCPQCEFLYEDEQVFCDMDGEGLVHDSRAEVFSESTPAAASASQKHSRSRLMIVAVVSGLLLSAVLSFAYHAATRSIDFDRGSPSRQPESKLSQQLAATPVDNSSAPPAASPSQSQPDTGSDSPPLSANELASPSASPSGRAHSVAKTGDNSSSTGDTRLTIPKQVAPLPRLNPLPQLPSAQRLSSAKSTAALPVTATSGKHKLETRTETSQKSVIVEVKPSNKRSKVGTFFKKTGSLLAKPFKH
jgi:hypothetical protein